MALRDFIAVINRVDVARTNRFVVEIQPPQMAGLKPQEQINLMCQDVSFPGQNIRTSTDDLRQGPTRDIAQAVTYGNTNMTFICTPGLPEKLFFEAWQKLMYNSVTWQAKYYKSYIGQIKLRQLDRTDMVRYGVILHEAYPKIINAQDYSNTAADTIQTLQVEFVYHHWSMDTELYDGTKRYGSEGGADQDKIPKRTVMAGTEDMTAAEAWAFLKGETRNALGQTYGEALAAARGTKGNAVMANLTTKLMSSTGEFPQAVATNPYTGKGSPGLVVNAKEAVNSDVQLNWALAKKPTGYEREWPSPKIEEDEPSTLFCRPQIKKQQAVATLPNGATISADAAPTQKALGLTFGRLAALAGKLNKPSPKQFDPRGSYIDAPAVQTDADWILKELQAAVGGDGAAAALWVNRNTGKRVGGGTGVKAGGNLLGGLAAGLGMLGGGYKGAISSSGDGIMQQALGMATARGGGGIKISATISLGGGGGGATSLIAKGLSSGIGIGIPRFGGIPAVRGAGFQVRSVGYNRPRSSRRGAGPGGAEGGGAAEAGVGD